MLQPKYIPQAPERKKVCRNLNEKIKNVEKQTIPQDRRIKQIQKEDGTYIHAALTVQGISKKDELFELFESFWKKVEEIVE